MKNIHCARTSLIAGGGSPGSSRNQRSRLGLPLPATKQSAISAVSRTRGFMLADAMIGIAILAGLAVIAATCAGWQRRASREMADVRAATDLAEATLIDLHRGLPTTVEEKKVRVEPVLGGEKIAGYSWVRVTATCNGHAVSLVGLSKE